MMHVDRARLAAVLIVAFVVAGSIRFNAFSAGLIDSAAYMAAGRQWAGGQLFSPAEMVFWAPWASNPQIEAPLGMTPSSTRGAVTGAYPLGYPVLLGAAIKAGGELAAHVVAPIAAGVLVWCAYVLAAQLTSAWGGVFAALLVAASPVTIHHALVPMSDVPAVALWAVAWVIAIRPGAGAALAAGCATALAVMVRPNLAPLAVVIAASLAASEPPLSLRTAKRFVLYGTSAAVGPLMVLWSHHVLYGSVFRSGYDAPLAYFFDFSRVPENARRYPALLIELHTVVAFAGLLYAAVALVPSRRRPTTGKRSLITAGAVAMVVINYSLYLPYLTHEGWQWLRFMLPALLALFVLLGAAVDALRIGLARYHRLLGVAVVVPLAAVVLTPLEHIRAPTRLARIELMSRYMSASLQPNAVILAYVHGATLLAATGRPTLRLDLIAPETLSRVVGDLTRRGYHPVYVLDGEVEGALFADRFRSAEVSRLTWPARAEFVDGSSVTLYALRDRDAFARGDRWTTDVLVEPPEAAAPTAWASFRAPLERFSLPVEGEVLAFRSWLETMYASTLGRPSSLNRVAPREATLWTARYLRYRMHGCDHVTATGYIVEQMGGGRIAPLCASPPQAQFPPRHETAAFRSELEAGSGAAGKWTTAIDLEGQAVWLQEYLQLRLSNCSDAEAIRDIQEQIAAHPRSGCRATQ